MCEAFERKLCNWVAFCKLLLDIFCLNFHISFKYLFLVGVVVVMVDPYFPLLISARSVNMFLLDLL